MTFYSQISSGVHLVVDTGLVCIANMRHEVFSFRVYCCDELMSLFLNVNFISAISSLKLVEPEAFKLPRFTSLIRKISVMNNLVVMLGLLKVFKNVVVNLLEILKSKSLSLNVFFESVELDTNAVLCSTVIEDRSESLWC